MICELCGGSGCFRYADVYRDVKTGASHVVWELGQTITCPCKEK